MKEYKKPLVEVVEIETEDVITASTGILMHTLDNGETVTVDYSADIFGE